MPKNEIEWRASSQAWAIPDFFELLKKQYRELKWIPISTREVIDVETNHEDGLISMIQGIIREHGWTSEEGAVYRKRECLTAVKTALREHYPDLYMLD